MAPPFLYDLSKVDLNKTIIGIEGIRTILAHRHEMEMLTGITHIDDDQDVVIAYKDITLDDFWVRGHIPGRPLMPGVLMIECAAQLCAYRTQALYPERGFIGFARCDDVIFRAPVIPPTRLYMIGKMIEHSRRRSIAKCQGIHNGTLVFEATVTGMSI